MLLLSLPLSSIDAGLSTRRTVGLSSSSSIPIATGAGLPATPCAFDAVADTVTVLARASVSLSTAVMVTVPVLAVAPAATTSSVPSWRKSFRVAGVTGAAATRTVVSAPDGWVRVALIRAVPPSSSIDAADRTSITAGAASSSVTVSSTGAGAGRPGNPPTAAVTRTVVAGESVSLFTAVTVTVPVLAVAPAPTVSTRLSLRDTAPYAGAIGAAATV